MTQSKRTQMREKRLQQQARNTQIMIVLGGLVLLVIAVALWMNRSGSAAPTNTNVVAPTVASLQ